jgi:hypothetical protein
MGESSRAKISVSGSELESFAVETPGGRLHIIWDYEARATPNAQLAFFAGFLTTTGAYVAWVKSCPLLYGGSSGGDRHKQDVLGTRFLSILAGHHRCSPIAGRRGDGVSPQILGMSKIVSEDALRRALAHPRGSWPCKEGRGAVPASRPLQDPIACIVARIVIRQHRKMSRYWPAFANQHRFSGSMACE